MTVTATAPRRVRPQAGLATRATWLAWGRTRAQEARRLGVCPSDLEKALTRHARKTRKLDAARTARRAAAGGCFTAAPVTRAGCGTYLALLLHRALGEGPCDDCVQNAAWRGLVAARQPDAWYSPVTPAEARRNRDILERELKASAARKQGGA